MPHRVEPAQGTAPVGLVAEPGAPAVPRAAAKPASLRREHPRPLHCPRCGCDWKDLRSIECPGCGVSVIAALRHAESNEKARRAGRAEYVRAMVLLGSSWAVLLGLLSPFGDPGDLEWFLLKQAVSVPIATLVFAAAVVLWTGQNQPWPVAIMRIGAVMAIGDVASFLTASLPIIFVHEVVPALVVGAATVKLLGLDYQEGLIIGMMLAATKLGVHSVLASSTSNATPMLTVSLLVIAVAWVGVFTFNRISSGRLTPAERNLCEHCGYDIRGLRRGICPECGAVLKRTR